MRRISGRVASSVLCGIALAAIGCSENGTVYRSTPSLPAATVSTSSLSFGSIPLGITSPTQNVTLTSTGPANTSLGFAGVSISGPNASSFLATSNCPPILPSGKVCAVSVAFAPALSGPLSATLSIADNAQGEPQHVALAGTGTSTGPVVSLSATALTFAALPIGQAATQTVTLSNIGTFPLNLSGFALGGANATSFALSGSCLTTASVSPNSSCFLTVTYAPTVLGVVNAVVNINDNAPNSPQAISLMSH